MTIRIKTTASLLAALASGNMLGCSGSSEETSDENPSGGAGARPIAPAAEPAPGFLTAYSETNRYRLGHPRAIEVLPNGGVLFLRSPARSHEGTLYYFDPDTNQERELLTSSLLLAGADEELSEEEAARRERMRLTATGIASFVVSPNGEQLVIPLSGRLFLVERARVREPNGIRELVSTAGAAIDPQFSPDGTSLAVVRGGDLYVVNLATGVERRLTTRASEQIENGLAEFVAQEEMGRMRGFWWSPDSQSIAYQETDVTALERMHILDPMHPENEPDARPYPRPGRANAAVRLGIIGASGGPTRWLEWDRSRFEYLADVRWKSGPLLVLLQDRLQEEEVLFRVDEASLEMTSLLTETDAAWLNLDNSVPVWLEAPQVGFLWSSEREGEAKLELHDANGQLVRALSDDGFGYRELLHVDAAGGTALVSASAEPTETHLFRIRLDGEGAPTALSHAEGEFAAVVGEHGHWVEIHNQLDGSIGYVVHAADDTVLGELSVAAEEAPFEPNLSFETVTERELRAVIVRPREFDEAQRYPVILHVYGGPHVRCVTHTRSPYLLDQWQADHNFIVVTIDGRGTPGRGRAFERAIDGDFIAVPLADQVEALAALGDRHPEMDMTRVGVWGWSFGGYFSAMAALREPEVFRAAVAGAPVSEWRDYDTHYTERYIGLPEAEGEEGSYQRSSVLTFAGETPLARHRPLLIIHGTADDNVYFSHALKLENELFRSGRPAELLALSGLTHMVPEPVVMERMHARIMGFFERNLRGD